MAFCLRLMGSALQTAGFYQFLCQLAELLTDQALVLTYTSLTNCLVSVQASVLCTGWYVHLANTIERSSVLYTQQVRLCLASTCIEKLLTPCPLCPGCRSELYIYRAYRFYFILLFLQSGVLSYFCPTFWVLSYSSYFLGFFLLLSYCLAFFPYFSYFLAFFLPEWHFYEIKRFLRVSQSIKTAVFFKKCLGLCHSLMLRNLHKYLWGSCIACIIATFRGLPLSNG